MDERNLIQINAYQRYPHRLNTAGEWLHYVAIIAKKRADLPASMIQG
jgi:hypothetical protein